MKKRFEYKLSLGRGADGKYHRKSFYSYKSKSDAKKIAMQWKKKHDVEEYFNGCCVTTSTHFSTWGLRCLETYKKKDVEPITYTGTYYDPFKNHLMPYFGNRDLNDITQMDIQEYVTKSCEKYAVSTVKKDVHVLNLIFRMAVINNLCLKNPVVEIHYPRETNKKEKRAFTQEQYDAAYELAKKWKNGASIMLMLALGLSRSELLGLKWENLDGEHHYISIEQSLVTYKDVDLNRNVLAVDNLKNEYRRRELSIVDDDLWERLWSINRYETVNGEEVETEFVFHNSKGKPWNPATWASRVFRPFMQALCTIHPDFPQLSVHEIRHTRGTLWVDQGVEPYMTTKMMGHCNMRMLRQVYDHTGADTLKKALLNPTR